MRQRPSGARSAGLCFPLIPLSGLHLSDLLIISQLTTRAASRSLYAAQTASLGATVARRQGTSRTVGLVPSRLPTVQATL